jgi:F-type H+-transporting ATPase subunit b
MTIPVVNPPAKLEFKTSHCALTRIARLAICGLFLLAFSTPVLSGAVTDSAVRQTASQGIVENAQSGRQSKVQAQRREEIRQKNIDNPEAEEGVNVYRHSPTVRKLAGMFGLSVEITSRIFEIINFILLAILIIWVVGKILPKALRSRTERIRNEIEQARVATEDANRRLAGVEERLMRLDSEIDGIRTRAEQETVIEEKRLRDALEQEKQSILESAAQDIDSATKNAQSELKKLAAELVIEHARRRIAITPEADQTLVAGFLTDLNEKHPHNGVN